MYMLIGYARLHTQDKDLAPQLDALRAAGFTEIGTLWQRGENRLLCAVMGG